MHRTFFAVVAAVIALGAMPSASATQAGAPKKPQGLQTPVTPSAEAADNPAHTYKLDEKGACHDETGKFAKKALCKPAHTYKLDDKGKCHDETGKFAKKAMCKA